MRIGNKLILNENISKQNINEVMIPPMLLLTFVENAFKHSKDTYQKKVLIDIHFQFSSGLLELIIKNNMPDEVKTIPRTEHSGIGLDVTKKRLDLLYGDSYFFQTFTKDGFYNVCLKIKTK